MKSCKRLSALLLALLLAFGIVPFSAAAKAANPAMPIITKQPESITVKCCEEFTLSVEAYIPNGDEVRYQWYEDGSQISDATGPTLTVPYFFDLFYYNYLYHFSKTRQAKIYCLVYNTGGGQVQSKTATVTMEICPEMPIITRQPRDTRTYFSGTVSLSVRARIPSGSPIGYSWSSLSGHGVGTDLDSYSVVNGATARITFKRHSSLSDSLTRNFHCLVYNEKDSEDYSGPHRAWSDEASVWHRWYGPIGTIVYFVRTPFQILRLIWLIFF